MRRLAQFIVYSMDKHREQVRKGSGAPYIVHPLSVMMRLVDHGVKDEVILAIAIGHDLFEDTDSTPEEVQAIMKKALVVEGIDQLTKLEKQSREQYFSGMEYRALLVKLSDGIDNARDSLSFVSGIRDRREQKRRAAKLGKKYSDYSHFARLRLTQLIQRGKKFEYADLMLEMIRKLRAYAFLYLSIEQDEKPKNRT